MRHAFFLVGSLAGMFFLSPFVFADEKEELGASLKKAQVCLQEEDYECAVDELQGILKIKPDQAPIRNLLGLAYSKQEGFIQSAIAEFEEAAALDPKYAEPYFNLGTLHAGTIHDSEAALDYFEKALRADPSYTRAEFAMAWIFMFEKKDLERALALFKTSAEKMPRLAEAHYGLALCYLQMNKRELALEPISHMRSMNREDLASKIEGFMQTGDLNRLARTQAPAGGAGPQGAPSGGPPPAGSQNAAPVSPPTPAPAG